MYIEFLNQETRNQFIVHSPVNILKHKNKRLIYSCDVLFDDFLKTTAASRTRGINSFIAECTLANNSSSSLAVNSWITKPNEQIISNKMCITLLFFHVARYWRYLAIEGIIRKLLPADEVAGKWWWLERSALMRLAGSGWRCGRVRGQQREAQVLLPAPCWAARSANAVVSMTTSSLSSYRLYAGQYHKLIGRSQTESEIHLHWFLAWLWEALEEVPLNLDLILRSVFAGSGSNRRQWIRINIVNNNVNSNLTSLVRSLVSTATWESWTTYISNSLVNSRPNVFNKWRLNCCWISGKGNCCKALSPFRKYKNN